MGAVFAIVMGLILLLASGSGRLAWPAWPPGPESIPLIWLFSGLYGVVGGINLLRRLKGR
jgi:hypothetical protein